MAAAALTAPAGRAGARPRAPLAVRRFWRPALLVAGLVLAGLELRGHLPDAASTWAALRVAAPGWLLAALVLQVVSMAAFAEQQRHLLGAFGVRMPVRAALALAYARSAMAAALPGGSAVSAGYAFRQFRARGAGQPVAAAVTLLSSVASFTGLVVLYAGDVLAWMQPPAPSPVTLVILAAGAVLAGLAVRHVRVISFTRRATGAAPPPVAADASRIARLRGTLRHTLTLAAAVPARRWLGVLAVAALNWLTDLACLLAAVHAVGLAVPLRTVATAYLAAQLIRQIPVTPGGLGVIEASLVVAFTAAGAATAPAAAAVLIYRLLSCWSVLPIGLAGWAARKPPTVAPARGISRPAPVSSLS
jgi:uncharacterized membrane protein YbhN (UPF0104 family)